MIEVKNLVKQYGGHRAVDDLSFTVEDGQVFGFLGPNGAGKSTTMNIITGYLAPTGGQVLIEGHDVALEPEEARKCVGYLPEQPPLYGDMTTREYLLFAAELKGIAKSDREAQVGRVMELTHLQEMAGRLIRNLSKGYRQRVGLAQAILGFPKIIILDEPTVGLDPKQVVEIRELIQSLAKEHTVILSSHILSEIRAVCSRVLIIRKGKFVACDTPEALEAKLSGDNGLDVAVRGEAAAVSAAVSGLSGVTVEESHVEGGCVRMRLSAKEDIREALFYACAQARLPIIEMHPRTATLEQVFLDLTDDDDTVAAKAAALLGGADAAQPDETQEEVQEA